MLSPHKRSKELVEEADEARGLAEEWEAKYMVGKGSQGTNRDKDLRPDRTDTRGSPVGSPILDRIDILDNPVGMIVWGLRTYD